MRKMKGKANLAFLVASFILYIMDIISDIYVAFQYYKHGERWWCGITLVFVLLPHLIINTYAAYINMNFHWYSLRKTVLMWIFQISVLASFKHEFTRWKREHWKNRDRERVSTRDGQHFTDVTLTMHHTFLRLAEAFAESAPQCCLQIYIMMRQWHFPWYTVLSSVLSLLSLSWSITSLETSCKTCQWARKTCSTSIKEEKEIPKISQVMFFVAHLCLLISRLTSLVIFAYSFRYYVFVIVVIHWLLVFTAICMGKKFENSTRINETDIRGRINLTLILNASLRTYPMVFCLSGSIAKISFRKKIGRNFGTFALVFYGIFFLENCVMVLLSVFNGTRPHINHLSKIVLPLMFVGFSVGVLLLMLYYKCCHPNKLFRRENLEATDTSLPNENQGKHQKEIYELKDTNCFVNEGTCFKDLESHLI
ncbi:XK-related protein 6-like [Dendronephthya gigantea]|uniref:XK-related protein 6-like n=1 Tax=Dendronephthya gigantea TaxID=151771 RepID=UPI00106A186A|nr:XK-related protein 6-like [Dendronephthya gigantea]